MGEAVLKQTNSDQNINLIVDTEFLGNFTSEHTRRSYQIDINKFTIYLFDLNYRIENWNEVERALIVDYRNFLNETGGRDGRPCAPKTIARKLAALSSYFDFLVEKGDCDFNPVSSVKRPRREVLDPTNALSKEQVKELFEEIENKKNNSRYLHSALLVTFFTTGLRKSEVINLKYSDYREINDYKILEFKGKGGKVGQKVLHPLCVDSLTRYLEWMKQQGREHEKEDWLFQPTKNPKDPLNLNKPLNPKTINEIVDHYAKKIGLNFKVRPHSARATFISELLDAGVDIYSVAREVNHSSVKTTQEYDKRRKRIADSPVFKLRY
jgi:integrase/recombinase XerD